MVIPGAIQESVELPHLKSRFLNHERSTQVNSKVGNLARKRRKFLSPERATIAYGKARVRTKNLLPS